MVIEIPGCRLRVKGRGNQWVVQRPDEKGESGWKNTHHYSALEYAMSKAYELSLSDAAVAVGIGEAAAECARIKKQLMDEVRRALKEADDD